MKHNYKALRHALCMVTLILIAVWFSDLHWGWCVAISYMCMGIVIGVHGYFNPLKK